MAEVIPVGTRWPSGTYSSAALLDISGEDIARAFDCELNSDIEPGLGPWQAIGLRLKSGTFVELIEYVHRPAKGFELRVDSGCNVRAALDDTLALLGIDSEAVLWRSPLI